MEQIVNLFFLSLAAYIAIGIVFTVFFLLKGIAVVDSASKDTSKVFKLLIIPGIIAMWPVLANKWRRSLKK